MNQKIGPLKLPSKRREKNKRKEKLPCLQDNIKRKFANYWTPRKDKRSRKEAYLKK